MFCFFVLTQASMAQIQKIVERSTVSLETLTASITIAATAERRSGM